MNDQVLLAEIISQSKPGPCAEPYVVVAYWPSGRRWKVQKEMYSRPDCDSIIQATHRLEEKGWTNISVVKLPI